MQQLAKKIYMKHVFPNMIRNFIKNFQSVLTLPSLLQFMNESFSINESVCLFTNKHTKKFILQHNSSLSHRKKKLMSNICKKHNK